eukprot:183518-Hanusia_phi.AAC.1
MRRRRRRRKGGEKGGRGSQAVVFIPAGCMGPGDWGRWGGIGTPRHPIDLVLGLLRDYKAPLKGVLSLYKRDLG